MKISRLTLLSILISMTVQSFSQTDSDLIIIDEIADDVEQLTARFSSHPNVFVTNAASTNAIEQITATMAGKQFKDMHIYALCKPGAIVFNSISLSSDKLIDFPYDLSPWSNKISGKVVIHSEDVFTGEAGILLKQRLETITGLEFIVQN